MAATTNPPMPPPARPRTITVILIVSALVAFGAASSDVYLPSLPSMVADLRTTAGLVQQTLTVFLFFYAIAQLFYSPLSDRFGRRVVLAVGVAVYFAASTACISVQSVETLIVLRIAQAFGAAVGAVVGRAVVRDLYGTEGAARVLAYIAMTMMATPILSPIIGGWLEETVGWRANFAFMAVFAAVALAAMIRFLPETIAERDPDAMKAGRIAANYLTLLSDARFLGYSLTATFGFAGVWAFITTSAFVLIDLAGLSPTEYSLAFGSMSGGYALGSFVSARISQRIGIDPAIGLGLGLYATGALLLNGFAIATHPSVASICVPMVVLSTGTGLLLANCQAGAIGPFPRMAGAASAMMGFLMMGGASPVGSLVAVAYDGTAFPMVVTALLSAMLSGLSFHRLIWRRRATLSTA